MDLCADFSDLLAEPPAAGLVTFSSVVARLATTPNRELPARRLGARESG